MSSYEEDAGGPIERSSGRRIPGSSDVKGQEVRYVSDGGKASFAELFNSLLRSSPAPLPKRGAVVARGCRIRPPGGTFFHAVSYHGDIDGFRQTIEEGAEALNVQTARIVAGKFTLRDGTAYALTECEVDFY
jgi:hypothetical protein